MGIFLSTLNQITVLFIFIIIGFILSKFNLIPDNSSTVLSKLENIIFIPALVLGTFMTNFTVNSFKKTGKLFLVSFIIAFIAMPTAILISKLTARGDKYIQNIYTYGLTFANFGFMGNAVVKGMFPEIFFEYLIFTLPLWILIYLWGVPVLLISDSGKQTLGGRIKAFLNPMFIAMIIGMIIGISGLKLPSFITSVVTVSGDCMSPVAMLITGMAVAKISLKKTFTNLKIYFISAIRLIIIPLIFIGVSKLITIPPTIFTCALCSLAMPLGLNTIVIPSAYGKDTTVASGMTVISHLLSVITIPLMFLFI